MNRAAAAWTAAASIATAFVAIAAWRASRGGADSEPPCATGFRFVDARCEIAGSWAPREAKVTIPASSLLLGPSDWEAEGRVSPRTIVTRAFAIDAFEVTVGDLDPAHEPAFERARAASGVTRDEAARFCASRGGRLPTDDEWMAAASAGTAPRANVARYPWGDTGAVCRRAAWGLAAGPCARGASGPGAVGAHPSGDTPLGLHDMAGNVAERVAEGGAHGGSWSSALATELRVWSRLEPSDAARDPRVGFRCAYDLAP